MNTPEMGALEQAIQILVAAQNLLPQPIVSMLTYSAIG